MRPQRTIELIRKLRSILTDQAFAVLHPTRANMRIEPHLDYMKKIKEIPPNGPTACIQRRLESVAKMFDLGERDIMNMVRRATNEVK
jgi:hypothetical protein